LQTRPKLGATASDWKQHHPLSTILTWERAYTTRKDEPAPEEQGGCERTYIAEEATSAIINNPTQRTIQLTSTSNQSLTEEEQKLFRLYGKLPNKKDLLQNKLKERKYFDSGDYALSKAGKSDNALVGGLGREHPSPDTIPHLSQQNSSSGSADGQHRGSISGPALTPTVSHGQAGSPVKESLLQRGMSVDEQDTDEVAKVAAQAQGDVDETGGVPIRR
jgi:hypothetical protein